MALSRRRKLVLILVLVPLLLVVLVITALFLPAVQTYAARKALAGQGGSVERVAAGLGGADLSGLQITQPGLKLTVPSFRADAPLTKLAGGNIEVRSLVARDIVVEIDPAAQPAEPVPKQEKPRKPFNGVLDAAQLPQLQVDGIDLAGRIRVLGPQPVDATFTLTGGGIRAGQAGELVLKVEAKAGLGSVVTTFTLVPTLGADGRLDALGAVAEAFAQSKLLASPARLRAKVDITRQAQGEAYALRLLAGETPLVELDTQWAPGATELPGRWKIAVRDADLKPFALGLALPQFSLQGGGELAFLGTEKLRVGGALDFAGDHFDNLGLPALGPVSLASKFAVEAGAAETRVESLKLDLTGGSPVLAVETRQPFSVALDTKKITPRQATEVLAEVRLLGVPAAWVKLFVPELTLAGPVTGAWTVRPEGDGFAVNSSQPLIANGVTYASAGKPLASFDSVRVEDLRATHSSAGLEASVGRLRVIGGGADLLSVKVDAAQKPGGPLQAKGELRALLAKLADQPVLRGQTRLSAGEANLSFDASVAETLQATAKLRLAGLRAAGAGDLPELTLDAEVARDAAGVVAFKAPVVVRNVAANRSSDLALQAGVTPGKDNTNHIVAHIGSRVLFVEDLQAFAAIAAESKPAAPAPAPAPAPGKAPPAQSPAPTGPLWAGTTGTVELDLARIVYAPGIEVTNTKGRFALSPETAKLERLQTVLGTGGSLDLSGGLRWLPAEKGYDLAADVKGQGVAVGPLLKALSPGQASKLEGTYDLAATVSGRGADPAAAATGAAAEIKLTGKQGRIRALDFDTNRYARLGTGVAGAVLGILGGSGDSRTAEIAGYASALLAITQQLSNLSYDELALEARRGPDGSVEIGRLDLLSPQLQLAGGGGLRMAPGRSLWELPLRLQVQVGAKGEVAQNLERLKLLRAPAADTPAGAFVQMQEPLVFDGTLRQVGTTQAMRVLTKAFGF